MLVASLLFAAHAHAADIAKYHYKGPSTVCFCETSQVIEEIRKAPDGTHMVWVEGWNAWKSWKDVPELVRAVGATGTSPVATNAWNYAGANGDILSLTTDEVAARVSADPSGVHRVWRAGMGGWASATEMPEIAAKVETAPPPLPEVESAPPPLPAVESAPPPLPEPPPRFVAPDRTNEPPRPDPGVRKEELPVVAGPVTPSSMHLGAPVRFGGDFMVDLAWDDMGSDTSVPTLRLNWARPRIDVAPAPWFSARAGLYLAQTTLADEVILEGEALSVAADEVWGEAHGKTGSVHHRVRVGVQAPIFAQVDSFEERVQLGGTNAWKSLAERADLVPRRDIGLTYGAGGTIWDLEIQAANGASGLDTNVGKDFSGRLTLRGGDYVTVSGSGLYGARAANSQASQIQGALVIDAHYSVVHANLEGIFGRTTERDQELFPGGFGGAVGVDLPLKSGPVAAVDITGFGQWFDPSFDDGVDLYDRWWVFGGGLNAHWRIAPGSDFLTGIVVEVYTPESTSLPVTTNASLQVGWSF